MDHQYLSLHIAAGILIAAAVIFMIRFGLTYLQKSKGAGTILALLMLGLGLVSSWAIIMGGLNP